MPYTFWSREGFAPMDSGYEIDPPPVGCLSKNGSYKGLASVIKHWEGRSAKVGFDVAATNGRQALCLHPDRRHRDRSTGAGQTAEVRQFLELPDIGGVPLSFTGSTEVANAMLSTISIARTDFDPHIS